MESKLYIVKQNVQMNVDNFQSKKKQPLVLLCVRFKMTATAHTVGKNKKEKETLCF